MVDLKKIIYATKLQLVIGVIINIITIAITYYAYSSMAEVKTLQDIISMSSNPLLIASSLIGYIGIAIAIWAGYVAVKKVEKSVVTGGLAGAYVCLVEALIGSVLVLIFVYPFTTKLMQISASSYGLSNQTISAIPNTFGTLAPFTIVFAVIGGLIEGFILGAIGGFLGTHFSKNISQTE